jgi:hypothetical protein
MANRLFLAPRSFLNAKRACFDRYAVPVLLRQEFVNSFKKQQTAAQNTATPGDWIFPDMKTGNEANQQTH